MGWDSTVLDAAKHDGVYRTFSQYRTTVFPVEQARAFERSKPTTCFLNKGKDSPQQDRIAAAGKVDPNNPDAVNYNPAYHYTTMLCGKRYPAHQIPCPRHKSRTQQRAEKPPAPPPTEADYDGKPAKEGPGGFWKRATVVDEQPSGGNWRTAQAESAPPGRWPASPAPASVLECGNKLLYKELHAALGLDREKCDGRTDRLKAMGTGGQLAPWVKNQYPAQDAQASFKTRRRRALYDQELVDQFYTEKRTDAVRPRSVCAVDLSRGARKQVQVYKSGHFKACDINPKMYDWTTWDEGQHRVAPKLDKAIGRDEHLISLAHGSAPAWFGSPVPDAPCSADLVVNAEKIQEQYEKRLWGNVDMSKGSDRFTDVQPGIELPAHHLLPDGKAMREFGDVSQPSPCFGHSDTVNFSTMRGRDGKYIENVESFLGKQSEETRRFLAQAKERIRKQRYEIASRGSQFARQRAAEAAKKRAAAPKRGPVADPIAERQAAQAAQKPKVAPPPIPTVEALPQPAMDKPVVPPDRLLQVTDRWATCYRANESEDPISSPLSSVENDLEGSPNSRSFDFTADLQDDLEATQKIDQDLGTTTEDAEQASEDGDGESVEDSKQVDADVHQGGAARELANELSTISGADGLSFGESPLAQAAEGPLAATGVS